jgi:hypothetical protein
MTQAVRRRSREIVSACVTWLALLSGCSSTGTDSGSIARTAADVGCGSTLDTPGEDLPDWASASTVPGGAPGIVSERGGLIAYPFARPLSVDPPKEGPLNKVLLYARVAAARLTITATLGGAEFTSSRSAEGGSSQSFPGYINVDSPGCWRVDVVSDVSTDTFFLHFI